MPLFSRRLLLFAAALAAMAGMAAWFWAVAPAHADEALEVERGPALNPQTSPFAAEITNIRFSSDPLYEGDATIYVDVRNLSSMGEATFRVILEIDPPGDDNTETHDLGTMAFGAPNSNGATKTFEKKDYKFLRTSLNRKYRFKAKVYSPSKDREFYEAATETSVKEVTYDADVGSISVSRSTIRQGDTATISATFTNQVKSNAGEATFDIDFQVIPPTGSPVVLRFAQDSDRIFDDDQSKRLEKRYRFQQLGIHTIKARIWNPSRTHMFKESVTTVDSTSPYAARVTDIRISPSPVYVGEATIYVSVRNYSSTNGPDDGRATFDVRLEVDPPGSGNTVYPADYDDDWDDVSFAANGRATLSKTYSFEKTTNPLTDYELKAEVYGIEGRENDWHSDHLFAGSSRTEKFKVNPVTYDADVGSISVSGGTIRQGDTATISATFTNQVKSNAGEATFDIDFQVIPPTGLPVVLRFAQDSDRNFEDDQSKRLEKTYRFQQRGIYTIKARIWNPDRSHMFKESETTVDSTSPYNAQVTDIRISPSPLRVGEATIYVDVLNRSSRNGPDDGAATFDVRLEVDPPGINNTEHPADNDDDWDDVSFAANETVTLSRTYPFTQTTGTHTRYWLKAEVYGINGRENNWGSDHLYSDATGTEEFEVADLPDLAVEIREQVTPVVGKPLTVPLILKNKGSSTSPEYNIRVAIGKPAGNLPLSEASSLVPSGNEATAGPLMRANLTDDYGLTFPSITKGLEPGPHILCVLIEYAGGDVDRDDSDNADCMAVYVLPDMGNDFPGEIQAFLHLDDYIQHRTGVDIDLSRHPGINIAGKLLSGEAIEETDLAVSPSTVAALGFGVLATARLEGEIGTGSEPFWVFVPTKYSTRYEGGEIKEETKELAEEIVERTWKGLESRDDREDAYEKLALEIARRGQTYGNKFISVGVTQEDKKRFVMAVETLTNAGVNELPESAETLIDHGDKVVDAAIVVEAALSKLNVNFEHVDLNVVHGHLDSLPLHKVNNGLLAAKIVVKTVGLGNDIRITESLNRSIFVGQATKTLELLADLEVDDAAWSAAIVEAQKKLAKMTSKEGLQSWSAAIEENLPNIAATYSQIALQVVAAKLVTAAVTVALTAAGIASLPVAVIAVPVTIAVAIAIDEIYEIVEESDKFWDGITLASMSTQVYSHIRSTLIEGGQDDADRLATEEIADYLEFAFYKHLARAAEANPDFAGADIGVLGDGRLTHNKLKDEREAIFHERDQILSEVLGGDWDHTQDFKFLEDAKRPLDIWSDGTTMWAMDGQSLNDYLIYAFDMSGRNERVDKKIHVRDEFPLFSLGSLVHTIDLFKDAEPRGIWSLDGIMWVADHDFEGATKIFGYRISDESKVFEIPEGKGFSLPDAGIWSDGTTMWFASWTTDCGIVAYDVERQMRNSRKDICDLAESNKRPYGLWSDGETMWVSDIDEGRIFAYSVRSGEQEPGVPAWGEREILKEIVSVKVIDVTEDSYPHIANNSSPTGIWSDGETMWVADSESDRIFAYTLLDSLSPPLDLTATVSGTGGDSQVDLTWQAPSDTGRTAITGYVMEESEDGLAWKQLVGNTGSTSTSYSDQRPAEWSVRHYRVAAINSSGAGPFSATVTALRTFGIVSIGCLPYFFYAGESVECSPTIAGDSPGEFTYAWQAHDGAVSWDAAGGSTASVAWDSPGAKQLRVVACRIGNPTEYINTTLSDVGPADTDVSQASGGDCAGAARTVHVADTTPKLAPWWKLPKDPIAVGESVDLEFSITRTNRVGGPGGITVSFPDLQLANSGDGSAPYESSQGKVTTVSYSGNNSQIDYLDSGITGKVEDADGNDVQPSYLIVATDNDQWPPPIVPPERKLKLRVTPEQAGEFRIYYRYWLCNEERRDEQGNPYCHHYPEPDNPDNGNGITLDQQGWAVRVFTLTVVAPPVIESLGCDSDTVDIGATVTCSPTYGGGDIDSYDWRAGHAVAGGNPWSGSDATFSTSWSYSGQQTVSLAVCNEVSGCVSEARTITVNPDPTEPTEPTEPTVIVITDMDDEEESPSDGGRVLLSGLASEWAHSSYSPTDTMIRVRAVPTAHMAKLEFTLSDEDGFAPAGGEYVSPGALVLALPADVWVDHAGITIEIQVAGSWVDYSSEFEMTFLALETISGGSQRTALTALGLAPASVDGPLAPTDHLDWGLNRAGRGQVDDLFKATYANCVSHVTVPWLALAAQTTAVRVSIPVDVSTDDYVSLALAAITAEGEDGEEQTLVQVHDLLATGGDAPECQSPQPATQ